MNIILKLVNMLEIKYVRMPLIVILIIYAAAIAPNLSHRVNEIMNHTVVRIFVLLSVVLLAHKDIVMALLLAVAYLMSSGKIVENLKNKDESDKLSDSDNSDKLSESDNSDNSDNSDKLSESDNSDNSDNSDKLSESDNSDKLSELGQTNSVATSSDNADNTDNTDNTDNDESRKELKKKNIKIENFEMDTGCKPIGSNSRYNCFDNTGDASPCSPCGEVGAFDNEIGPQGLSNMVGYTGTEYSQV